MTNTPSYLDLLRPDHTVDLSVYAALLAVKVEQEVNLRLCVRERLMVPRHMRLGEIHEWRAAQVKERGLTIDPAERVRVEGYERAELDEWIKHWRDGAGKQRVAMIAAE